MEVLTSKGLIISPNVALPVTVATQDDVTAAVVNKSETSGGADENDIPIITTTQSSSTSSNTAERRKDKWNKNSITSKSQLPINLISTTNQQKVSQILEIRQTLPMKLVSKLSSGSSGSSSNSSNNNSGQVSCSSSSGSNSGGPQQIFPMKLSQDESKPRRSSSSGYQRLSSDSFSPPSSEAVSFTNRTEIGEYIVTKKNCKIKILLGYTLFK